MGVAVAVEGRVATVTLDRPDQRNALTASMCDEIVNALSEIDASGARAVVVAGAGPVFCAGADLGAVSGPGALEFLPAFERMLEAVARFRLPTIAAIQGAALGGGWQLATVCDFRLAATDAKIGIPSSRLGIVVNYENVERLVLLAGIARAKEIMLAGRTYSGAAAAAAGLVTESVEASEVADRARALAAQIAALAPRSVQGAKRAIGVVADSLTRARASRPEDVAAIDALVSKAYASADLAEGIAALAAKREPDFTGH